MQKKCSNLQCGKTCARCQPFPPHAWVTYVGPSSYVPAPKKILDEQMFKIARCGKTCAHCHPSPPYAHMGDIRRSLFICHVLYSAQHMKLISFLFLYLLLYLFLCLFPCSVLDTHNSLFISLRTSHFISLFTSLFTSLILSSSPPQSLQ